MTIIASAAPVGAVDAKSITFKKFALEGEGKGSTSGQNDKPMVAAASMVGGHKVMRITLGGGLGNSAEDAVGDVMDGHEELSRIFVTLPTTTTTTSTLAPSISTTSTVSTSDVQTMESSLVANEANKIEAKPSVTAAAPRVGGDQEHEGLWRETVKEKDVETVELSSIDPNVIDSMSEALKSREAQGTGTDPSGVARIVQVSVNTTEEGELWAESKSNGLTSMPGMSIEDSEKKIDNQNIQNLVLQDEEDVDAADLNGTAGNRNRKSKGLSEGETNVNKNLLTRSTSGDETIEASNPEARLQPAVAQNLNRSPNLLIQFSDSDKLELMNSQNNALTSDDLSRTRTSNFGLISGISFSVLALFCTMSLVGAMLYRRRYINKPQTLSEPDSSGYIDDSIIRVSCTEMRGLQEINRISLLLQENSDEMYSLDNDSFLNSLEAMTIQNYWTDHVKHTKL